MKTHTTKVDEMLDRIVDDHFGNTGKEAMDATFAANPGIERYGLLLPPGLKVALPDRDTTTRDAIPVIRQIRLWE